MTSTAPSAEPKKSQVVTTIHRIYNEGEDINFLRHDPATRRSFINKSAYAKLHRSLSSGVQKRSVDHLKHRYERNSIEVSSLTPTKETIKKDEKHEESKELVNAETEKKRISKTLVDEAVQLRQASKIPQPKPRRLSKPTPASPKDENSNLVKPDDNADDKTEDKDEEYEERIVIRPAPSVESIDKIAHELSHFTMDRSKKRNGSFRKLFSGSLFGKDKKKKEDGWRKADETIRETYTENRQNESNFSRNTPHRHTVQGNFNQGHSNSNYRRQEESVRNEILPENVEEIEQQYAEMHINRFNQIRQNFAEPKVNDYLPMDKERRKPKISDYISVPVTKYIDTSSSTSTESSEKSKQFPPQMNGDGRNGRDTRDGRSRDTPPRAQETHQNLKLIKPKAAIPLNSERSLPNPYQNEKTSPRTIERNLNLADKDYPDKVSKPYLEDTYGTVFDSLEYVASRNGEIKPVNSPKSPSLEGSKLRLPSNREIMEVQPRVKSPIPSNRVSTEKLIATELLRNSRPPTPPKRMDRNISSPLMGSQMLGYNHDGKQINYENVPVKNVNQHDKSPQKPPILPKPVTVVNSSPEKVVTNVLIHAPSRSQTPVNYMNLPPQARASTPVDLRISAALKLSPQKDDIRKSVEEYYWKELKKMKEEQDYQLHVMQLSNGYAEDPNARVRRSRSLSPNTKLGRRSLSLPRDTRQPNGEYVENPYGSRVLPHQSIPEDRALIITNGGSLGPQAFIRNNTARSTFNGATTDNGNQRPIFRRGSLNKQEMNENYGTNKKVSFSSSQSEQAWPTRNGYTQSPPQRRLEKRDNALDDEVFLPSEPEPVYGYRPRGYPQQHYQNYPQNQNYSQNQNYVQNLNSSQNRMHVNYAANEPVYGVRQEPIYGIRQEPIYGVRQEPIYGVRQEAIYGIRQEPVYGGRQEPNYGTKVIQEPIYGARRPVEPSLVSPSIGSRRPSVESIPRSEIYVTRGQIDPRRLSNSSRRDIYIADDVYGVYGYQKSEPTYVQRFSPQRQNDPKQVTVTNKFCDIYGQIHDGPQKTGVIMGQLQRGPMSPPPARQSYIPQQNFVRGSRLTASANDMGRRLLSETPQRHRSDVMPAETTSYEQLAINYDSRPLPPVPGNRKKQVPSDTESGSDAGEVQRIMQSKGKSKKRGFFGK